MLTREKLDIPSKLLLGPDIAQNQQALARQQYDFMRAVQRYFDRLNNNGALQISANKVYSKLGFQFPANQGAAVSDPNTLDDYAEGTWTPVLTFATPGDLSVVYTNQVGFYTKIGRLVTVGFRVLTSTFTFTTASGILEITGLPFAANSLSGAIYVGGCVFGGITKAGFTQVNPQVNASDNKITFVASASGSAASNVSASDTPTAGTMSLRGTVSYIV
jgi:hypothetical protein